ncbi:hypothetical protein ACSU1L_00575 [Microbacterium sp. A94]
MLELLLSAAVALSTPSSPVAFGCSQIDVLVGECTPEGDEVVIGGTEVVPGSPPGHNPGRPIGNDGPHPAPAPIPPPIDQDFVDCLDDWDSYIRCFERTNEDVEPDEEDVVEIPTVTISDVVRFAPHGSLVAGEPDNVGVVGLPTNFVASADEHTVSGELFGYPMVVRFTPVGFDFDYGDGATTTTSTGGLSWDALGAAQFTPTETSHTYAARGIYAADVSVRYTAAVDFGIGWFPITGEVTSTGAAQEIRIFEAHTALVAHTCEQDPRSPGC